jgi:hypothetical protein
LPIILTGDSYTLRKEKKAQENEEAQAAKETEEDEAQEEVSKNDYFLEIKKHLNT